eukprot:993727-Rhodomonas_salina.1
MISPEGMEEMTGNMQLAIDKTLQTLCVEKQRPIEDDIEPYDLDVQRLLALIPDRRSKVDSFRASVIQLRNDLLRDHGLEDTAALTERLREMNDVKEKLEAAAKDAVAARDPGRRCSLLMPERGARCPDLTRECCLRGDGRLAVGGVEELQAAQAREDASGVEAEAGVAARGTAAQSAESRVAGPGHCADGEGVPGVRGHQDGRAGGA